MSVEFSDGERYPVEKVDQLCRRVAALLGIKLLQWESRPTILFTTPEAIRELYRVNGGGHYLSGAMPIAGYVGGKVLSWGYDASNIGRYIAYHLALQQLHLDPSQAESLAARIEARIALETMNPFSGF